MNYVALFLAAFAPGLFWLWYFYKKDKLEPEPKALIVKMFFLGMGLGIPATMLELLFTESLFAIGVLAPVIEESLKFLGVRLTVYRRPEFSEPLDGIVYTAAVALGFASVENWFYLWAAYLNATDLSQSLDALSPLGIIVSVFLIRALLSVPSHVLYSCMWGYALGRAKFSSPKEGRALVQRGLVLAIFCHALFNVFASHLPEAALGEVVLVVIMWKIVLRKIREGVTLSPYREH